jgi:hypothetical protein
MTNTFRATTVPLGSDTSFTQLGSPSNENLNSTLPPCNANAGLIDGQDERVDGGSQSEKSTSPLTTISCPVQAERSANALHLTKTVTAMRMKILIASANEGEVQSLRYGLEELAHRVLTCCGLSEGARWLRDWQPDLLITEENLVRGDRNCGLRLAELCRMATERGQGTFCTQALILVPVADWDRMKRAQGTGAHVIVKSPSFDAVVRYVQTIADRLTTDRVLGPILFGIHRFRGVAPQRFCSSCGWVGASLSYGTSQTDVPLTCVRATILNSLLFCRRGLSPAEIAGMIDQHRFLKSLLKGRTLRQSAIKMEITRLRQDIEEALRRIGAPYGGNHFVPLVQHGFERYRLAGNWQLSHVPTDM